jgi:chitinase
MDIYTESNTIDNFADIDPNISGPYSLNGTWVRPLAISDVSILEGSTGATAFVFTVRLSAPSSEAVSVNYTTANASATDGNDFQAAAGTLVIPAGETTGTITVLVNGDQVAEPNETFLINLSGPINAVIVDGQGVGTIADDEPRVSISTDFVSITEGNTGTTDAVLTVSLSTAYGHDVTVDYNTSDDSAIAGDDYVHTVGTLRFDAGQTSQMIRVPVIGDDVAESEEHFHLNLHNPSSNAAIIGGFAVGEILNDDTEIRIYDVSAQEGNTAATRFTFYVGLSFASAQPVTVSYATADGSAMAGSDYYSTSGTLTFAPGQTLLAVTVDVIGDRLPEPNENFVVHLSSPTNATISGGLGFATIVDDEPRISISDVTKAEGRKGKTTLFVFTVTLSAAYDEPVTMSFQTANSTATTGDNDYIAKTGTLTFAPGETTKTITVTAKGDSKKEADETFYVDLFGLSSNALFTKNRGLGTILNDD